MYLKIGQILRHFFFSFFQPNAIFFKTLAEGMLYTNDATNQTTL